MREIKGSTANEKQQKKGEDTKRARDEEDSTEDKRLKKDRNIWKKTKQKKITNRKRK